MTKALSDARQLIYAEEGKELNLAQLIKILWSGKYIVCIFLISISSFGLFYVISLPDEYTATGLLASVDTDEGGGLSKGFGGLASLAGVNLGGLPEKNKNLALEILKSKRFLIQVANKSKITPYLIASTGWNSKTDTLEVDPKIYNIRTNQWSSEWLAPGKLGPSKKTIYESFINRLVVAEDINSGFVRISLTFYSPTLAYQWLKNLIDEINGELKRKDIQEAEKNIDYLKEQIQKTNILQMQKVLYELIEGEVRKSMLANVRDDYVFEYIDPPLIPEVKSDPKRTLLLSLFCMAGLGLGILTVCILYFLGLDRFFLKSINNT